VNITVSSAAGLVEDVRFLGTVTCSGDSTFSTTTGISGSNVSGRLTFQRVVLGVATGIYTAHVSSDLSVNSVNNGVQWDLGRAQLASTTEIANYPVNTYPLYSYIAMMRKDETTGVHQTLTPLGTIARETSTVDVSPGMKLTPNIATTYGYRLESGARRPGRGYLVGVASGGTATVSVKVRKDSSYAGDAPRLILKANAAAGIASDVVIATLSVGADTWETLTGTTAAVDDDCVLEFVVDCNGTAGNVLVDTWSGGGDGSVKYWHNGLPNSAGAAGSGGGSREFGFAHVG
jgi:hypothetical protein